MLLSDEEKELVKQKIKDRRRELWGASMPAPPTNRIADSAKSPNVAESTASANQAPTTLSSLRQRQTPPSSDQPGSGYTDRLCPVSYGSKPV